MRIPFLKQQDPNVIPALRALRSEYPGCASYIGDMEMYAQIGKDRRKVGMDYVEGVREGCKRNAEMEKLIASMTKSPSA